MPATQLEIFSDRNRVVNVASVPQRSPFRYAGGKTWLIPRIRTWLAQFNPAETTLVEPFAGGGIVSLSAAFENLVHRVVMTELDEEVAAVWQTIFSTNNVWLAQRILNFNLSLENVNFELTRTDKQIRDIAFCTILKNRTFHGGILAKGAGFLKKGENGKGIASRWYPETLYKRITDIAGVMDRVAFSHEDAFDVLETFRQQRDHVFFIDPPYVKAGKRLYTLYDINHRNLFTAAANLEGNFLMTYDDKEEIQALAQEFGFAYKQIPMKTTHHVSKLELLISNSAAVLERI